MMRDFISLVKTRGLARTNRYKVIIPFPVMDVDESGDSLNTTEVANLFCESLSLPGANIATTPSRTFGEVREMPYEKIYDNISFSFYVDSSLEIKVAFEKWMNMIYNTDTRTIGYYRDYVKSIDIEVHNVDESIPYVVTLFEAYPKSINAIQLDANGRDVMKLSVTMEYRYWKSSAMGQPSRVTRPLTQDPQSILTSTGFSSEYELTGGSYPTVPISYMTTA